MCYLTSLDRCSCCSHFIKKGTELCSDCRFNIEFRGSCANTPYCTKNDKKPSPILLVVENPEWKVQKKAAYESRRTRVLNGLNTQGKV